MVIKFILFILCFFSVILSCILKSPKLFRKICNLYFKYGFEFKENFNKIPDKPCILMNNYCCKRGNAIGYFSQFTLPVNYCLVVSDRVIPLIRNILEEDRIIYVDMKSKKNYDKVKKIIKEKIEKGYYIFCYIENNKDILEYYKLGNLRSGMFSIAKQLDIPIVPIVMDTITYTEGIFFSPKYRIYIGEKMYVKDVEESKKEVAKWMRKKLNFMAIDRL